MRYLRATTEVGIVFRRCQPSDAYKITAYADADFAGHAGDSKSTSGYILMMGGPITWSSRRQRLTALSTTKAEIYALADAAKEAVWIGNLLKDMRLMLNDNSIVIMEDNAACYALVTGTKALTGRSTWRFASVTSATELKRKMETIVNTTMGDETARALLSAPISNHSRPRESVKNLTPMTGSGLLRFDRTWPSPIGTAWSMQSIPIHSHRATCPK